MFAAAGAAAASKAVRKSKQGNVSVGFLKALQNEIGHLKQEDAQKLTDLGKTLTGHAFLNRMLKKNRQHRIDQCNKVTHQLCDMKVLTADQFDFFPVYKAMTSFPLYGKTRSVNFARALNTGRMDIRTRLLKMSRQ